MGVPYGGELPAKIKEKAKIKEWPTREINGGIIIYYDNELRMPPFEVPIDTDVYGSDKNWSSYQHLHYSARTYV